MKCSAKYAWEALSSLETKNALCLSLFSKKIHAITQFSMACSHSLLIAFFQLVGLITCSGSPSNNKLIWSGLNTSHESKDIIEFSFYVQVCMYARQTVTLGNGLQTQVCMCKEGLWWSVCLHIMSSTMLTATFTYFQIYVEKVHRSWWRNSPKTCLIDALGSTPAFHSSLLWHTHQMNCKGDWKASNLRGV